MKMLKAIFSGILLLGMISCSNLSDVSTCGLDYEPIPGYSNAGQKVIGDYFDAERTSIAMDIFYDKWVEKSEDYDEVASILSGVCVKWEPYPWIVESLGNYEDGVPKRAAGLTESRRLVRVFIGENEDSLGNEIERTISATALWHELVHLTLWNLNDEPDPDHEGSSYSGWETDETQVIIDSRIEGNHLGI